jgi:hypothetical protein
MLILVLGIFRLIVSLSKTDPMAKANGIKSALISIGLGVMLIILFSTVLKRDRGSSDDNQSSPAPVNQNTPAPQTP